MQVLANAAVNQAPLTAIQDADLADFRLDQLQVELGKMSPGPDRDYLAGLLANRRGQVGDSTALLNRALPALRKSQDVRTSVALKTIADDYTKLFNYGAAAKAYDELFALFSTKSWRHQGRRWSIAPSGWG